MIVQVQYRPTVEPLHGYDFGNESRLYTFDDVNDFASQDSPLKQVTKEEFGSVVWGTDLEDRSEAIFGYRPPDDSTKVHVMVDFANGDSEKQLPYAMIRAAKWRDSRNNFHYLVLSENAYAYLMTNEGKTIRKF